MKKNYKRFTALILGALTAFSMTACGGNGDKNGENATGKVSEKGTPVAYSKVSLRGQDTDTLPVGTFLGPMDGYFGNGYKLDSLINANSFKQMQDCHINYIMDPRNALFGEYGETLLDFADEYKISYIMRDLDLVSLESPISSFVAESETMVARLQTVVTDHPYFAGLYGRDEPSTALYSYIDKSWEEFKEARTALNATDLTLYYNLFPPVGGNQLSYDTDSGLTYDEYLQGFMDTDPDYLMFDSYPFLEGTDKISGSWFNLLGQIKAKADSKNVPWWGYVQCGGHYPDVSMGHRVVHENEMNWNVNTMLCFGAKGIAYFPGFFPPEWGIQYPDIFTEQNTNDNSLINKYGTKTPFWYYAEKINEQISAVDHVLMNSAHMGVIIHGEGPEGCKFTGNTVKTMDSFRILKSVSGDDAIVGCLDYKGGVALYVMNNSITEHRGEVTLNFDDTYEYEVVQRSVSNSLVAKSFTLTLEAGEAVLVIVK